MMFCNWKVGLPTCPWPIAPFLERRNSPKQSARLIVVDERFLQMALTGCKGEASCTHHSDAHLPWSYLGYAWIAILWTSPVYGAADSLCMSHTIIPQSQMRSTNPSAYIFVSMSKLLIIVQLSAASRANCRIIPLHQNPPKYGVWFGKLSKWPQTTKETIRDLACLTIEVRDFLQPLKTQMMIEWGQIRPLEGHYASDASGALLP